MGRGRAKAKQTKVARELKYNSGGTDLDALRRELVVPGSEEDEDDEQFEDDDPYEAELYSRYADLVEGHEDEDNGAARPA
jgi:hypothetical protein